MQKNWNCWKEKPNKTSNGCSLIHGKWSFHTEPKCYINNVELNNNSLTNLGSVLSDNNDHTNGRIGSCRKSFYSLQMQDFAIMVLTLKRLYLLVTVNILYIGLIHYICLSRVLKI